MFPVQRIVGDDGSRYLTRVHLTPWKRWPFDKRAYLHIFHRPDADPHLHDHPFAFRSIVLWGGYEEIVAQPQYQLAREDAQGRLWKWAQTYRNQRWWLSNRWVPATYRHTITRLFCTPTVTLVIRGGKERDWGFWQPGVDQERFTIWHEYLGIPYEPPAYARKAA